MTKPTREQKRERIKEMLDFFFHKGAEEDDIDRAILADYDAPLSEERRAELEWRRQHVRIGVEMWEPGSEHHEHCKRWLAELDAELEGDDG